MINGLYNFSLLVYGLLLKGASLFHPKAKLWVQGRKNQGLKLSQFDPKNKRVIWIHCASLGEFEQGRPIIEKIKKQAPQTCIVLSFYSPSGYEVRKDYKLADLVVYLPLDRPKKVQNFIDKIQPSQAIFIKYEIWPNYYAELHKRSISLYLISAIFSNNQRFFTSIAKKWFAKPLHQITHFFVQNQESKNLLESIGITNVDVTGDTRFDRVLAIANQNKPIQEITNFVGSSTALILGSSWPADEELLKNFINDHDFNFKIIIAPHEIHQSRIASLLASFGETATLFSQLSKNKSEKKRILILDNMGMLSRAYSSANIAIIGGGFGKGIHNTLEAAAYGIPILFGPNHQKFQEAKDLIKEGAAVSIKNQLEFDTQIIVLLTNKEERNRRGKTALKYVNKGKGATDLIVEFLLNKEKSEP